MYTIIKNRSKVSVLIFFIFLFFFLQYEFQAHWHSLWSNMFRSSIYLGIDEVPCPVSWIDSEVLELYISIIILKSDASSIIKILVSISVQHERQNHRRWSVLLLITSLYANLSISEKNCLLEPFKWFRFCKSVLKSHRSKICTYTYADIHIDILYEACNTRLTLAFPKSKKLLQVSST